MVGGFGRIRRGLALGVVAGALAVIPASAGTCGAHVRFPDDWIRISGPSSMAGTYLTSYDVADHSVDRIVVTDGAALAATADRGCTWRDATLPADLPVPDPALGEQRLTSQAIRQARFATGTANVVWAIGEANLAVGDVVSPRPRVLFSEDGGGTFVSRTDGLPGTGRPLAIRGVGGTYAYLLFQESVPATSYSLYETTDSGVTWEPLWTKLPALQDLTVDPIGGLRLWVWGERGLFTGVPSDTEPDSVIAVSGPVSAVDVDSVSRIVRVFLESGGERFTSYDGGQTFVRLPSPEGVESATSLTVRPGLSVLATSSMETNVLVETVGGLAVAADYSPRKENVSQVKLVKTLDEAGVPLLAYSPSAVYLRFVPLSELIPPVSEKPIDVKVHDRQVDLPPASIEPAGEVVTLRQGQRRVVGYTVSLPPVPTPLDVFFMTDSTGSMSGTIRGVQEGVQDIVDALTATGVDLHFGVADFRDYPQDVVHADNYPYRLHRTTGPVNARLAAALKSIETGGGTDDGDDSALEAIFQAATGDGRVDPLLVRGELIAPGQDADFRPDAMKVILVASDDGMRQPDANNPGYPGPALATVKEALVERGIYLVGLEVVTNTEDSAREEMEELAAASGALASSAGIDCDGDGQRDVDAGAPLVCEFYPDAGSYVADAFIGMLNGIQDIATVDLAVTAPGSFVRPRGTTHHPRVNVKRPSTFTLPVEFRCTPQNAGITTPVRIAVRSRGDELVATTATLDCIAPEVPDDHVAQQQFGLPPLPPPVAPLAPISHPQPPVNTNPNPQLNANTGMAAQEDQEFQLALAGSEDVARGDEELAMTSLAWATAFTMTACAAFGLKRSVRDSRA